MRLHEINIAQGAKVTIYGALNYRCFSIACTSDEFEELKKTGVLINDISDYVSFISISCSVNAKRSQDLISKALSMGIQITYFGNID